MECVNLKQRFGNRYRVDYEESYYSERGGDARADDPWLQILLARHGHIYPHGGEMLAASTDRHGAVAGKLVRLKCTSIVQDGDDGVTVIFHADDFDEVAAIMKPRRRKQLSGLELARLADMGRKSLDRYRQVNVQEPKTDPQTLATAPAASEAA